MLIEASAGVGVIHRSLRMLDDLSRNVLDCLYLASTALAINPTYWTGSLVHLFISFFEFRIVEQLHILITQFGRRIADAINMDLR
jgi:hypothetical protein